LLANRVCGLHTIRDASGDVGFRNADGEMIRIDRRSFQRQLATALEEAFTRANFWGGYSDG
jgi:hypothetical protein